LTISKSSPRCEGYAVGSDHIGILVFAQRGRVRSSRTIHLGQEWNEKADTIDKFVRNDYAGEPTPDYTDIFEKQFPACNCDLQNSGSWSNFGSVRNWRDASTPVAKGARCLAKPPTMFLHVLQCCLGREQLRLLGCP
jgi:hypothetical protein